MALFNLNLEGDILKVGFGDPASNDEIVKEVAQSVKAVKEQVHGKILKINGAASLPVATVLGHELAHVVAALAVYDPKLSKYVVTVSHGAAVRVGELID